jgi:hypothetical protein
MCIELYCCNSDWPDNNLRCFRVKEDASDPSAEGIRDGRYRFLLKDLDLAFGHGHDVKKDPYHTIGGQSALLIRNVFNNLMHNETFKNRVYMYFCTLATAVFDPVRVNNTIGELTLAMLPEMEYTAKNLGVGGGSVSAWRGHITGLRSFAIKRVDAVLDATVRESGKKLADLNVILNGDGEAELGWFPASDGEVRRYPMSTVIPLTVPEGTSVTVTGGTYQNGVLLLTAEEPVGTAQVILGLGPAELLPAEDFLLVLPKDFDPAALELRITRFSPLLAPCRAGEELGSVQLLLDGEELGTVPLVAAADVPLRDLSPLLGELLDSVLLKISR